ncbi:MAG: glycosyltransferase family 4 protein [Planctomycetia bacterium]|jgi:glycosyltransferase involved in cell wall biosynthesis
MTGSASAPARDTALVVACLFDGSGMATWCIEAAEALAEQGERVCLVHSDALQVPKLSSGIELVPVDSKCVIPRVKCRIKGLEFERMSAKPGPFLREACGRLDRFGIVPRAFLFNAPFFIDPAIPVPQCVVAWAYPASFVGYMRKLPTFHDKLLSVNGIRTILDNIGTYRRDWFGYRQAAAVMAVSGRLDAELRAGGVRSGIVHPGTRLETPVSRSRRDPLQLVTMAVDLDTPRKRVPWMLEALRDFPVNAELTLIGECSARTYELAAATGMPVHATGRLPRAEALDVLRSCDVFLFGSMIDDWGYVLLEAMSSGLDVVAADLSPFDEMVGPAGSLYSPFSSTSFRDTAIAVCKRDATPDGVRQEWLTRFSRPTFGRQLQAVADAARARCSPARR